MQNHYPPKTSRKSILKRMKNNYKSILLFGFLMAFFAVLLQFMEYRYYIGNLDTDIYTAVVATIFTVVGIWIGINLLKPRKRQDVPEKTSQINEDKIKELNLNGREYEVLQLIAKGFSNQEIANQLFLALPTVKTHLSNLYAKLDVRSRTQAVHKAQLMNLI